MSSSGILINNKINIKDTTKSITTKQTKTIIKSFNTIWKIYYKDTLNVEHNMLTPCKFNFIIEKNNNTISISANSFCLGYQNFEPYISGYPPSSTISDISFELNNVNNSLFQLPPKFRPSSNISINAELGIITGNYIEAQPDYSKVNPATITLKINTDGIIRIEDCDFITTTNIIFYGNSFKINYNV